MRRYFIDSNNRLLNNKTTTRGRCFMCKWFILILPLVKCHDEC